MAKTGTAVKNKAFRTGLTMRKRVLGPDYVKRQFKGPDDFSAIAADPHRWTRFTASRRRSPRSKRRNARSSAGRRRVALAEALDSSEASVLDVITNPFAYGSTSIAFSLTWICTCPFPPT